MNLRLKVKRKVAIMLLPISLEPVLQSSLMIRIATEESIWKTGSSGARVVVKLLEVVAGREGRKGMVVTLGLLLNFGRKSQGDAKSGHKHFAFNIGLSNTFSLK